MIVSQISRSDGISLVVATEAYARVGIAAHDAFICCWNTKDTYNVQRPVTYINRNIDRNWLPYIATPNFPSYTSGHSTQSGAAALVLTDMFGVKSFRDTTHIEGHARTRTSLGVRDPHIELPGSPSAGQQRDIVRRTRDSGLDA